MEEEDTFGQKSVKTTENAAFSFSNSMVLYLAPLTVSPFS
jgi:hypothetical protein